ncbi:MAG: hypothetical protein ACE5D7_07705 [Fidelibacterota bacterium]
MPQPGTGNIFSDPEFFDSESFDFSLLGTSSCIDAGDPEEIDPDNTPIDIGAIYFHQNTNEQNGDCNSDGFINVIDIILLVNNCIITEDELEACLECGDTNQDGSIDVLDVVLMVNLITGG